MAPVQLSNVSGTLLPPTITGPIFLKAQETSAVMNLARRVPLSVTAQTAIPVPMDVPTAGWVGEGGAKPLSTSGVGVKLMTGKKVAVLIPVSQEVVMSNAAGLYAQLEQDLPTAISRAFDHAAIHGTDLKSGGAGPFQDYLKMTPHTQVLGTSSAAQGGIYRDLVLGEQQIMQSPGYEFSGFAADPRLKPELMLSVDTQGRPLWADNVTGMSGNGGMVTGYPAFYNSGVSGRLYRQNGLGTNDVQTFTAPGSGSYTLSFNGQTTSSLAFNASAATIQAALANLGQGGNDITVSGTGPFVLTFGGVHGSAPQAAIVASAGSIVHTTPGVSGDTGLRAIGGDFSQCAYGVGMDITIKVSTEANYYDGSNWHSAFQENLVLLLAEAYYGFVVGSTDAFVSYTSAIGT